MANSHLAHAAFQQVFTGPRWDTLAAAGARPQRPLWASTGVKDPAYPDTRYVAELVIPGTVNTMPEQTLRAFADHGEIPTSPTITLTAAAQAQIVFDDLVRVGINLTEVFLALENEGVAKFVTSWAELTATVADQLSRAQP